jgi:PAS domain S-box-containing protein
MALVKGANPIAPFLLFYPAIALAAFFGGAGPGIAVMVAAGLFGAFVFPVFPGAASWVLLGALGSILVVGFARLRGFRDRSAAVAAESARLRLVIEHVSDWIFLLDESRKIEYVNRTACRALGFESTELLGRPLEELEAETQNAALPSLVEQCRDGTVTPAEIVLRRGDGSQVTAEVSCSAIRTRETLVIHVAARDVTERKQIDRKLREARQWESLGALSGGLAHDFNNLLTSIMGNAALAREIVAVDREAVTLLEGVEHAGERCASLIHLMLATSGYRSAARETVRVDELLRETIAARPFPKGVSVRVDSEACEFESDRATMLTLLNGLLANAAESYGESGGEVAVCVRLGELPRLGQASFEEGKARPGKYLGVVVEDQGCGMAGDVAERAFNPFFTTKFTGRGLGLPAVRGIVRAHSGILWMRTKPGEGTRVEVWLPAASYHLSAPLPTHV